MWKTLRLFFRLAIIFNLFALPASAQFYLRGEVRDERGKTMSNVRINLHSKGTYPYYTGTLGSFGIPVASLLDTITLYMDGYEVLQAPIETNRYQFFTLKMLPATKSKVHLKLSSKTKDLLNKEINKFTVTGESYTSLIENDFVTAQHYPETGFAISIDRASYSNIRRFLNQEGRVPSDAVRIEEMLNYFSQDNVNATGKFRNTTQLTSCPWNKTNQLLFFNLEAPKLDLEILPPSNLVFLIDVSGSMDKDNRLPLIQSAFKLLVDNLRAKDTVTIVVYGSATGIALPPTSGIEKKKIKDAIDDLSAGGSTPGESAIRIAYDIAKRSFIVNGNNRVILATDGDFNVGQTTEKELEELVTENRKSGIYLTCLGVGMGNYKDSKLEILAKKGNGNFAYIDNYKEGEKIMLHEFTKTMYSVADDAFVSVNFNPAYVKEYRLIGFDNKKDAVADSTSDLEGGEVGTGHNLRAVFEIVPTSFNLSHCTQAFEIGKMQLQYKLPGKVNILKQDLSLLTTYSPIEKADSATRFAAAVCMFGMMLKQSEYAKAISWEELIAFAYPAIKPTEPLQLEFITLIEKAKKIYSGKNKKKRD